MHRFSLLLSIVVLVSAITLGAAPAAVAQQSSPVAVEATREPLFATMIPAESLPPGPEHTFLIAHSTIAPGIEVAVTAEFTACCPGPGFEHVLAGELTLRVEGPLQVVRGATDGTAGPVEEVAPETEVVLRSGDTAVFAAELPVTYANRGAEPVQLASGSLIQGRPIGSGRTGILLNNYDAVFPVPSLPAGPITLTLEQATLAPGAMLPGPPPGAVQVVTSGPKVAYLPEASDGSVTNFVREPVVAYVLTLLPGGPEDGTSAATPMA